MRHQHEPATGGGEDRRPGDVGLVTGAGDNARVRQVRVNYRGPGVLDPEGLLRTAHSLAVDVLSGQQEVVGTIILREDSGPCPRGFDAAAPSHLDGAEYYPLRELQYFPKSHSVKTRCGHLE